MKERPILFNTAMVQAILAGRKTQTRRAVKPQPSAKHNWHGWIIESTCRKDEGKACWAIGESPLLTNPHRVKPPFGKVGDRLWVRETHSFVPDSDEPAGCSAVLYVADGKKYGKARPSIHMPRWACRIILEITNVRVERLHDISDADAMAEGIQGFYSTGEEEPDRFGIKAEYCGFGTAGSWKFCETPVKAFQQLWYSTGVQWNANPWVWVVEFKVLTTNGKVPEVAA